MKVDWLVIRSWAISFRLDRRVPVMLLSLLAVTGVAMVMNVGRVNILSLPWIL